MLTAVKSKDWDQNCNDSWTFKNSNRGNTLLLCLIHNQFFCIFLLLSCLWQPQSYLMMWLLLLFKQIQATVESDLEHRKNCFNISGRSILATPFPTHYWTLHLRQRIPFWRHFLALIQHLRSVHYQVPDIIRTVKILCYNRHHHSPDFYRLTLRWRNISLRMVSTPEWTHPICIPRSQMNVNNALDNLTNVN